MVVPTDKRTGVVCIYAVNLLFWMLFRSSWSGGSLPDTEKQQCLSWKVSRGHCDIVVTDLYYKKIACFRSIPPDRLKQITDLLESDIMIRYDIVHVRTYVHMCVRNELWLK